MQMSCGNCGNGTFRIYQTEEVTGDGLSGVMELRAECCKCDSRTQIRAAPSKMVLSALWDSAGTLCIMDEKSAVAP